ncbi:MAG TPA: DUF5615 family PIN-like protein [Aggregatilineales bacterium]|nr:DUF5615 family PIN-like protein [Aggregatilineales bacterium]
MTILLDACVPRKFGRLLELWGYSVVLSQSQIAPDASDSDVLMLAQSLDAVLLTIDLDFSNILDYPPYETMGIVVLRYTIEEEDTLTETLQEALQHLYREGLRKALVIVSPGRYRIRR